jgi:predicted porin
MVAAAGILLGAAVKPVNAADLGGGCCADLEERVAELEATTARKGNRVVSLQLYGQVNKALMIWDDGIDSDAYVVDNDASSSRFGLTGSGKIKPGWTAGFKIEAEVDSAASNTVGQDDAVALELGSNGDDGQRETGLNVRRVESYIESERLGRVSIGLISGAIDDITLIDLAGTSANSQDNYFSPGFFVRTAQGLTDEETYFATNTVPPVGGVSWGDIAPSLDRGREDAIRYDTPSIYGFIVSAAWGEDDYWDIALRFKKEWNSIRIAAGIGYMDDMDTGGDDIESVRGSISIMHVPTGIYGNFAAINNDEDDAGPLDGEYYYFALGIAKNWTGHGNTIIYGEYGNYSDFGIGTAVNIDQDGLLDEDEVIASDVNYWGFGIEQKFDSAALSVYLNFKFYEADLAFDDGVDAFVNNTVTEDFQAVVIGTKIQF